MHMHVGAASKRVTSDVIDKDMLLDSTVSILWICRDGNIQIGMHLGMLYLPKYALPCDTGRLHTR